MLVLGMQDTTRMTEERSKVEAAKGLLNDANAQVDGLEQQIDRMSLRMRKVATGLHLAIIPTNRSVRSAGSAPSSGLRA